MITLVCGPPCSGKSSYVREHAAPGDLVLDYDDLAVELGSPRSHQHSFPIGRAAGRRYDELLEEVSAGLHPRAWVIRCAAVPSHRAALAQRIKADQVVVLVPPRGTLHARAAARPDPVKARRDIDAWLAAQPTASASSWSGRKVARLTAVTLQVKGTVCHLCGLDGADSPDHQPPRVQLIAAGVADPDDPAFLFPSHLLCNKRRQDRAITDELRAELREKREADLVRERMASALSPRFAARRADLLRAGRTPAGSPAAPYPRVPTEKNRS